MGSGSDQINCWAVIFSASSATITGGKRCVSFILWAAVRYGTALQSSPRPEKSSPSVAQTSTGELSLDIIKTQVNQITNFQDSYRRLFLLANALFVWKAFLRFSL